MGIFSAIGDAISGIWKGIKKVFKKVMKVVSKVMNSALGKVLMLALTVFTFGAALMAGYGAFTNTAGSFLTKFIAGGKEFALSLVGKGSQKAAEIAPGAAGGASITSGGQIAPGVAGGGAPVAAPMTAGGSLNQSGSMAMGPGATGDTMQRAVTAGGGGATGQGAMLPAQVGDAAKIAELTTPASGGIAAKEGGNWLSRAATAAMDFASPVVDPFLDFAQTDGGGRIIGSVLQGYAGGKQQEAQFEHDKRIERQWANPNDPGRVALENQNLGYQGQVPNWIAQQTEIVNERNRNYVPSVPYTRAPAPTPEGG